MFTLYFLQLEFALNIEDLKMKFRRLFRFKCVDKITRLDEEQSEWQKFIAVFADGDFDKEIEDSDETTLEKVSL